MIDMNFEPQLIRILDLLPSSNIRPEKEEDVDATKRYRQTIMFSATMPQKVEMLAKKYLRHPIFISIGDRKGKINERIDQRVEFINGGQKLKRLLEILSSEEPPFIVFCNAKKTCDAVARQLEQGGHACVVLHGSKIQDQRMENLDAFKNGEVQVLVATDVVGRGIDIQGVKQVINFDMPQNIDKYAHRIGRTGRAGMRGMATSFLTNEDTDIMFDLKEYLQKANAEIPPELARHDAAQQKPGAAPSKGGGRGGGDRNKVIYAKH